MTVATATVSTVPTAISAIQEPARTQAHRRAVRLADELGQGRDPGHDQPEAGPGRAEQGLLGQQHPHHLPRGEPEGLQHRDVLALEQDPARGDVGDGARGGDQGDDAEQGQQQAQQPVVAGHRLLDLLPGGVALDGRGRVLVRAVVGVPDGLHDLAGGHRRVVPQPQADDLLGLPRAGLDLGQQPLLHPDQAGCPLRVEALVGGVGDTDHMNLDLRAVDAVDGDPVPHPHVHGRGERRLQDGAILGRGPQPAARHHERRGMAGKTGVMAAIPPASGPGPAQAWPKRPGRPG